MLTLEQRFEKLERRLRLYQMMFVSILAVVGFLSITAFKKNSAPDLIQAKEFQVVDEQGKVLISLKNGNNAGSIELYNSSGIDIINLLSSNTGTGSILTKSKEGNFACKILGYIDGGGDLEIYNAQNQIADNLGRTDKNTGYLSLKNTDGSDMMKVTYTEGNLGGWLGLFNNSGKNLMTLNSSVSGNGAFALFDYQGMELLKFGSSTSGNGYLSVFDNKKNELVNLGVTTTGDGMVSIYNHSNNRIAALGADANSNGVLNILNSAGQNMNGVWPK